MKLELTNKEVLEVIRDQEGSRLVNGEEISADVLKLSNKEYHVLKDGKSYRVSVEEWDGQERKIALRINGKRVEFREKSRYEDLLRSLGMEAGAGAKAKDLKAPMPGLVVDVLVAPGQEVVKGDSLLILEAMKMENVIKATAPGTVSSILVDSKDSVEKGQTLIAFGG